MKKFFSLVCCSIFIFTGCGKVSYFQSTDSNEVINEQAEGGEVVVEESSSSIYVQVAGAVATPGVYELQADSRVYAAMDAAGGL
jgi:competence protein ComEA